MAVAALVMSIIALVKVAILFHGYGAAGHGYATGGVYGGYGRDGPTEHVYHAPGPIEYGYHEEHGHHEEHANREQHGHQDIHGDGPGYNSYGAKGRAENIHRTGQEGRQSSPSSSTADSQNSKHSQTAKPGQIRFS